MLLQRVRRVQSNAPKCKTEPRSNEQTESSHREMADSLQSDMPGAYGMGPKTKRRKLSCSMGSWILCVCYGKDVLIFNESMSCHLYLFVNSTSNFETGEEQTLSLPYPVTYGTVLLLYELKLKMTCFRSFQRTDNGLFYWGSHNHP